jgi:hypothetical protein
MCSNCVVCTENGYYFRIVGENILLCYTGRFTMFSVITNTYNKKTNRTVHSHKKTDFFLQREMFDVCTTGDTVHIDTYSSYCHTRVNLGASIFFTAAMIHAFRSARSRGNGGTNTRSLT